MAGKGAIAGRHLVRYGIAADQKYLVGEFRETYDHLVINATMAAHQPPALAKFLMHGAMNKPYFIDPQTHAFQHEVEHLQSTSAKSTGEIKRSVKKLLERYGEPVKSQIEDDQSILPQDFENAVVRNDFCQRVLAFQLKSIAEEAEQSDATPYYEFLRDEGGEAFTASRPSLLVAPYFYMEGATLPQWLPINVACAKDCLAFARAEDLPLAVQVVVSRDVLFDSDQIKELSAEYAKIKPDVFLVWIDSFEEQDASVRALNGFVDFVRKLGKGGVPVVNLYGGYFSVLLMRRELLNGVTHSLEYGEQRSVVPVGGGIPVAKYYLPSLHYRMQARDALRAVRELAGSEGTAADFHENVCNCRQCRKVIRDRAEADFVEAYVKTKIVGGRGYPTPETKDNSVRHYMWCKRREFNETVDIYSIGMKLREMHERLQRAVGVENTIHCKNWAEVLEGLPK